MTASPHVGLLARFRTGLLWNVLGAFFNQGSTFAVNIITANLLGRSIFGEYATVQNTTATLASVAGLATGYTATRYVAEFRLTDKERAGRVLGICGSIALVTAGLAAVTLLLSARVIAWRALHAPALASQLRLAAAVLASAVVNGFLMGALSGLEAYRSLAKAGVIAGSAYLLVCSAGAKLGGLDGAVLGLVVSYLLQTAVLVLALRAACRAHGVQVRIREGWRERHVILHFALPAALSGFSTMPALWLAYACVARQAEGMPQVALFSAANSLRVLVMFVPTLINGVGMSILSNQRGLGDNAGYRRVFRLNLLGVAGVALVSAGFVALLGPWLLRVFGRSFASGYTVLLVLMATAVPEAVAIGLYQILQSQGRMWLSLFACALPRDLTTVLVTFLLAPRLGALALAAGYATGVLLELAATVAIVARLGIGIGPRDAARAPPASLAVGGQTP